MAQVSKIFELLVKADPFFGPVQNSRPIRFRTEDSQRMVQGKPVGTGVGLTP